MNKRMFRISGFVYDRTALKLTHFYINQSKSNEFKLEYNINIFHLLNPIIEYMDKNNLETGFSKKLSKNRIEAIHDELHRIVYDLLLDAGVITRRTKLVKIPTTEIVTTYCSKNYYFVAKSESGRTLLEFTASTPIH